MRLEDLAVFTVVSRFGNLHRAADEIGVTQSAVSKAIRRLESSLDLRLLERTATGVVLTEDGAALHLSAVKLQTSVDDIVREMKARKHGMTGLVRIGIVPGLVEPLLVPIIESMMKSHPAVRFKVRAQLSPALFRMVDDRELDLAIAALATPMPDGLNHEVIGEDGHCVVVRTGHPMESLGSAALGRLQWVLPTVGVPIRNWIDQVFASKGLTSPDVVVDTDAPPPALAEIVRRSDLATVFARGTMRSSSVRGLVALDAPEAASTTQLITVWKRGTYQSPLNQTIRELVLQAAANPVRIFHPGAGRTPDPSAN